MKAVCPGWITAAKYVSLSHAHNVGAAMLSQDYIVGIDVELQREQLFRIADKFLHPDEKLQIRPESVHWKTCMFTGVRKRPCLKYGSLVRLTLAMNYGLIRFHPNLLVQLPHRS
jgi:hypothetical protein